MVKYQIYENVIARQSGVGYSPIIRFETSLVDMDKAKSLNTSNKPEKSNHRKQRRYRCGSIKHLRIASKDCPAALAIRKAQKRPWGWGYLNMRQKSHHNMQHQRKRENVWR